MKEPSYTSIGEKGHLCCSKTSSFDHKDYDGVNYLNSTAKFQNDRTKNGRAKTADFYWSMKSLPYGEMQIPVKTLLGRTLFPRSERPE